MNIVIFYVIKFNKGKNKGKELELEIDLEDIELDGLDGYLIDNGYFDSYTNDGEFEVISRKVV